MNIKNFLAKHIQPATGCTEPIAVGYATALAYHALYDFPENAGKDNPSSIPEPQVKSVEKIVIKTDRNIYKNAKAVSIPGTKQQKGLPIAASIGLFCDPAKGLNLFEDITEEKIAKANKILEAGKLVIEKISDSEEKPDLDIQVNLIYRMNQDSIETRTAFVELKHQHDNISKIFVNEKTAYQQFVDKKEEDEKEEFPATIKELIAVSKNMTVEESEIIYNGLLMNNSIADEGLKGDYGLKVGKTLKAQIDKGIIDDSVISEVKIRTAAAGDARMSGATLSVMTTSGSGNQGILAVMPIAVIGEKFSLEKRKICEAALLSHLVTSFVARQSGDLSAICGCSIKAGFGAAAGVVYLLDGGEEEINNAINIVAANITGMICDGAKDSCALKLFTASEAATEAAFMAVSGMKVSPDNGIIFPRAEDTIRAVGKISLSMVSTDREIVKIMQEKGEPE